MEMSETLVLPVEKSIVPTPIPPPIRSTGAASSVSNASTASPSASTPARQAKQFPAPLIFPPLSGQHRQTLIVLHERGSTARRFAPPFVESCVTPPSVPITGLDSKTEHIAASKTATAGQQMSLPPSPSSASCFRNLQTLLPHTRLVFPSAPLRDATAFKRPLASQWFDMAPLEDSSECDYLMLDGLRETTAYLHRLIERESRLVGGPGNVAIGGFSQGCAASLIATLLWPGQPLRAVIGMAGWLPFRSHLGNLVGVPEKPSVSAMTESVVGGQTLVSQDKVVDCVKPTEGQTELERPSCLRQAVALLQKELGMPVLAKTENDVKAMAKGTPIFIGHGVEDSQVPIRLGDETVYDLSTFGFDVQYRKYNNLGHTYSDSMLGDLVAFLQHAKAS